MLAAWLNKDSPPHYKHIQMLGKDFISLKYIVWKKVSSQVPETKRKFKTRDVSSSDMWGTRKESGLDTGPMVNLVWRLFRLKLRPLLKTGTLKSPSRTWKENWMNSVYCPEKQQVSKLSFLGSRWEKIVILWKAPCPLWVLGMNLNCLHVIKVSVKKLT